MGWLSIFSLPGFWSASLGRGTMNLLLRLIVRLKGVSPIPERLISFSGPSERVELVTGGVGTNFSWFSEGSGILVKSIGFLEREIFGITARFFWVSEGSGTFLKSTGFLDRETYFFTAGTMPAREDPPDFAAGQVISSHKQYIQEAMIA